MKKENYEVFKMGSCVMWGLWKNRNEKIFNGKNKSIQSIIKEFVFFFHYSIPVLLEEEQNVITLTRKTAETT